MDTTTGQRCVQLRRLHHAALAEGATLLVLLGVAVPLKHLAGQPGLVTVMGPLHGLAFLYYLWTVSNTAAGDDWTRAEVVRMVACAMIPFGAWFSIRLVRRKAAALAGAAGR